MNLLRILVEVGLLALLFLPAIVLLRAGWKIYKERKKSK